MKKNSSHKSLIKDYNNVSPQDYNPKYEKAKRILTYIFAPCITFLIFAVIFKKYDLYPFGEKSIAWCDLKQQGIPLLMNFHDAFKGEGSLLYSINNASGMNFWGVFLFFLSNPFSFIALFFEKNEIYKLVDLLTILKLCTAALTASIYFAKTKEKLSKIFIIALSISYALCAYGLMYFQNIMWLDIMYLYPLLALGINKIATGKGYWLYATILALCVIFNFYLSFMVIIAVLLIIGFYLLSCKKSIDEKKSIALAFFKGSALAAMISAISWIPAFLQYSQSGRGKSTFETLATSNFISSINTITLLILSSVFVLIGLFALYKPDKRCKITFWLFLLFLVPIFIEPINKMWHTGSYMSFPGRYAFITIFTGLELTAIALEKRFYLFSPKKTAYKKPNKSVSPNDTTNLSLIERLKKEFTLKFTIKFIVSAILGIVCIKMLYDNISIKLFTENEETLSQFTNTLWGNKEQLDIVLKVAGIFATVYIVSMILYILDLIPKRIFSLFLVGVVICEGVFAVNTYMSSLANRNLYGEDYEKFLDLEGKIADEDFYRIKTERKYQDSNLLGALGYNSIGHYTSLTNLEYMNTSKALGYSSSWMELSTYGGTEFSNALLGVRYNVKKSTAKNNVYTNGRYSIYKTFASLGLGVKYNGENDVFSYDEYSRIDFQEKIFASLFNSDETLFSRYTPTSTEKTQIVKNGYKTEMIGKGSISYTIEVKGRETLYFDAFGEFSNALRQGINKGFKVYVNGKSITNNGFPDGMYTGLVNLGTFQNKTVNVKIEVQKNYMSLISFGVAGLKTDVLKNAVDNAESGYMTFNGRTAKGSVEGKAGEYLFVSIPYDDGFTVRVNGEKVECEKVFGDFFSIPLKDGVNEIEMKYTPPGFIIGLLITLLGIIAAIFITIYERKREALFNGCSKACPIVFYLLFAGVTLAVYVFPLIVNIFFHK